MGNRSNSQVREGDETLLQSNNPDRNFVNDGIISLLVNNEQMQVKKIFAVKNPVLLKRETLSLERDSNNRQLYYISFSYDAAVPFDINFYLNAKKCKGYNKLKPGENLISNNNDSEQKIILISEDKNNDSDSDDKNYMYYKPGKNFLNKKISIKNIVQGQGIKFFDKCAVLDSVHYTENKMEVADSYDLVIEIVPIFESISSEAASEILFYTFCKLTNDDVNINNGLHGGNSKSVPQNNFKVKVELQKLRTQNMWLDIYEVFNSALENGECLICCHNIRNTIFLPCKHSCTCQNCAHSLRMRNNPCPICKNSIDDLVIIDIDKQNDAGV